jgi:asparagine synthetase B (glutamine-hydrolysing)
MREISYLHLTRFVQFLLDRKDRMSMAVGLEVRVPSAITAWWTTCSTSRSVSRRSMDGKKHPTRCDP